jgi:hypothetical protein
MSEHDEQIPKAWQKMKEKHEAGYYQGPNVEHTRETGQSLQSRLRHLTPDPVPDVPEEKHLLDTVREQIAKLIRRRK